MIEMLADTMMVITLRSKLYQINTLYTLNLHNVTCQLYLNKINKQAKKRFASSAVT